MQKIIRSALVATFCGLVVLPVLAAESGEVIRQSTAQARKSLEFALPGEPGKLEFRFEEASAWLRSDGAWKMEAVIEHQGLLCGTYQLGLRFGIGNPGCSDVQWVDATLLGKRRRHCNSAILKHETSGEDSRLKEKFAGISCAERVILCDGSCRGGGLRF
ncbi:MAG: hypothetical protein LJE84_01665 [Gammaproteobacteria bacterium]|nr:hypothetical protein [Gammaproteobacteria bacterium]